MTRSRASALLASRLRFRTCDPLHCEDADSDHLVKNTDELVAATHVADDHTTGIDIAEPIVAQQFW